MQLENQISSARELGWQRPPGGGPGGGGPRRARRALRGQCASTVACLRSTAAVSNFPIGVQRSRELDGHSRRLLGGLREHRLSRRVPGLRSRSLSRPRRHDESHQLRFAPSGGSGPGSRHGRLGQRRARAALRGPQPDRDAASIINNEVVANLAGTGFNDRASSLRIEGGYWIFCSDANFHGRVPDLRAGRLRDAAVGPRATGSRRAGASATTTRTTRIRTGSAASHRCRSSTTSRGSRGF